MPLKPALIAFRDRVLADAQLRDLLRPIECPHAFAAEAAARGSGFSQDDVAEALRGPALPGDPGGLPYAARIFGAACSASWIDGGPLSDPFFDDTVIRRLRHPLTRFTRREAPLPRAADGFAPAGLIFHLSRCGSTLAGRMLSAAGVRVVSEAPPLDAVIQAGCVECIRDMAAALAAREPTVFKLDPCHIHALPLLREAFPSTPWTFLYRDPLEVLASHARMPGRHVLPGGLDPRAVAMLPEDITAVPRSEWPFRVLARMMEAALRQSADPLGLFLDYRDLPDAVCGPVARHFGIGSDPAAMRETARFHAKNPATEFQPDSEAKQREGAAFRALARDAGLDRLYDALASIRESEVFSA